MTEPQQMPELTQYYTQWPAISHTHEYMCCVLSFICSYERLAVKYRPRAIYCTATTHVTNSGIFFFRFVVEYHEYIGDQRPYNFQANVSAYNMTAGAAAVRIGIFRPSPHFFLCALSALRATHTHRDSEMQLPNNNNDMC